MLSYTNSRDSFIKADRIGCRTQLEHVPPNVNNFKMSAPQLAELPQTVKQTWWTEFALSLPTHAQNFDLKYSINSPFEPARPLIISAPNLLISRRDRIEKKEINQKYLSTKRPGFTRSRSASRSGSSGGAGSGLRSTSPVFCRCYLFIDKFCQIFRSTY